MRVALILMMTVSSFAGPLAGQATATWHPIAHPTRPRDAAWDPGRQRTVFWTTSPIQQWEWNGAGVEHRQHVTEGISGVLWLGSDRQRGQLLAVANAYGGMNRGVGRWDGARWSWQNATAPFTSAEFCFDEVRRRIVAYEGNGAIHEFDGTVWWSSTPSPAPQPRGWAAFAYDPIGRRCILYGGATNNTVLGDCWAFDGSSWRLLAANAAAGPRSHAAMAHAPGLGGLMLYGGTTATTTYRLLGNGWQAVPTTNDPGPMSGGRLVQDATSMLLVGTYDPAGSVWRFSGSSWTLIDRFTVPWSRFLGAGAFDRVRGQTLTFGGVGRTDAGQLFDTRFRDITATAQPSPRSHVAMCWSPGEQQIVLFGGEDTSGARFADTWNWTGIDWVQRSPAVSPPMRSRAAIAEDPSGGVLLFGGVNGTGALADQWRWDGTNWRQMTPAMLPSSNGPAVAALDRARNRVVLLCDAGVPLTWEYDGITWTQAGPGLVFSAVRPLQLAFDPRRQRVMATDSSTLFEWSGSTWTPVPVLGAISGLVAVVTDDVRQALVAIGTTNTGGAHSLTSWPNAAESFGSGCALGPTPVLHAMMSPTIGNATFALEVGTLAPLAPTFLGFGFVARSIPIGNGCSIHFAMPVASAFTLAEPGGRARWAMPIPNAVSLRGVEFVAQAAVVDPPRGLIGPVTLTQGMR
ncbi:MAG: hypothetical protein KDC98_17945, partial [Planctomycetes bacterium]|nr:hypothetical protein [Planctomycetota bacterium]